ncbi:hypothetical protein S2M10_11990 [Sphingomonas sp. S2M10]|uniref:hypothetical protein n=1 Tax=Sphingomonas sp. S2M10 TaxID=2705010 RepID=UPI001456732A|nr:hypothetical protein [Sphingomonas sp. S2M10]NLS26218.1 hypothetical protein [Sphingomonas sp. S2M10]
MTAERERMVADMVRKMDRDVEALMQRNVDVAQVVFNNTEVTAMVIQVAASVCGAAIMVAMQTRRPEVDPNNLYDVVAKAIAEKVQDRKRLLPQILAVLETERAKAGGRR